MNRVRFGLGLLWRLRRQFGASMAALLFAACTLTQAVPVAEAAAATTIVLVLNERQATVNGDTVTLDTAPVLDMATSRTFVPVRFIGETLGAYIGWDGEQQMVTYLTGDTHITLWIGRKEANVNDRPVQLDAAPYVDANGRTLVPVRFVTEQMGAEVSWDGDRQAVTIAAPWVGRVVVMQDHTFFPARLEVAAGTRVTWVNLDNTTHDVFSATIESPAMKLGQAFSYTFTAVGTYLYGCSYHDNMTGTVLVR